MNEMREGSAKEDRGMKIENLVKRVKGLRGKAPHCIKVATPPDKGTDPRDPRDRRITFRISLYWIASLFTQPSGFFVSSTPLNQPLATRKPVKIRTSSGICD